MTLEPIYMNNFKDLYEYRTKNCIETRRSQAVEEGELARKNYVFRRAAFDCTGERGSLSIG